MFNTAANVPAPELETRLTTMQRQMAAAGLDGVLLLQHTDLFYFSGTSQQAHLYLPVEGAPILMVKKNLRRARAESAIDTIISLSGPGQLPESLKKHGYEQPRTLGMELDVLPANLYLRYRRLWPEARLRDCSPMIRMVRAVKSAYEIGLMREAANLSDQVAAYAATIIREGMPEIELAGLLEAEARRLGHQGLIRMRMWGSEMFYGHLMSGAAAAVPSQLASPTGGEALSPAFAQGPGRKKVQRNEPVLFDYVFAHQGYLADSTRIYCLGSLPPALAAAHDAMLDLQDLMAREACPGRISGELYAAAENFVREKGYADNFMGGDDQRVRFVGHGIGLEVDEYPVIAAGQKMPLEEGMVVALEPKLIFPGQGVVGIENTHLITGSGLERLTRFDDGIVYL